MSTSGISGPKDDIRHIEANLVRLFTIVSDSLETIEKSMREGKATDLSANASLAEHLKDTIYSEALFFIAKWQPLGHELLYVEALIKVSYDLFRIVRYANEIELTLSLTNGIKIRNEIVEVAERAHKMVSKAFEALIKRRKEEAKDIDELDEYIDKAYRGFLEQIASKENVSKEEALEAIILRQLERVADHATYIAKEVLRILSS